VKATELATKQSFTIEVARAVATERGIDFGAVKHEAQVIWSDDFNPEDLGAIPDLPMKDEATMVGRSRRGSRRR
jgi:hypothetical protein